MVALGPLLGPCIAIIVGVMRQRFWDVVESDMLETTQFAYVCVCFWSGPNNLTGQ